MTVRTNKTTAQSNKAEDPRIVAARAAHAAKKAEAAAKAKKPVAKAAVEVADEVVPPADAEAGDIKSAWQKFIGAFDELHNHPDFTAPSWQRVVCSVIASSLAGSGVVYLGGSIVSILVLGTMALTASAFLTMVVMVIGYALTLLAAFLLGGRVHKFIMTGECDVTFAAVKSKVTGFFGRIGGEKEPAHA